MREGAAFTHVSVAKRGDSRCCDPLEEALRHDGRYALVYDGPGAAIFARLATDVDHPGGV